ncbi:MAG: sugar ABC transporter permease [Dehalococcoidales bacterium]|nr:sugar ABC transporter permease [Dehalococcoidales bacterium]
MQRLIEPSPHAVLRPARRISSTTREALWGYAFISPWVIGLLAFSAGPILAALYYSFTDYPAMGSPTWTGLTNYQKLFTDDPLFWKSLYNTGFYVLFSVPLHQLAAFFLALMLVGGKRGTNFFRTAFYLPVMIPFVAMAVMWKAVLHPTVGLLNQLLLTVGLPTVNLLASDVAVKPVLVVLTLWLVGTPMIVYLAGLQNIPEQLHEAASIDGANGFRRLIHVTVPMLTPTILFNVILDIINSFQVFAHALIITDGGPVNASLFYVLYLYRQAFEYFKMGYASALAVILFVVILFFTLVILRSSSSWVHYDQT